MTTKSSHPAGSPRSVECTILPGPFPVDPLRLGHGIVTVIVGAETEWLTRRFVVHRSLLELASASFKDELEDIADDTQEELELPDDCPMAFEVLYHWMYSGMVYDHSFYPAGARTDYSRFWCNVYIFAGRRRLPGLKKEAFLKLQKKFNDQCGEVPSLGLLDELFNFHRDDDCDDDCANGCDNHSDSDCGDDCDAENESPHKLLLKNYFLEHVAFWLVKSCNTDQWTLWKRLMQDFKVDDIGFAEQIACKLAEWASNNQPFSNRRHPSHDPTYCDCGTLASPNEAASDCTENRNETRERNSLEGEGDGE